MPDELSLLSLILTLRPTQAWPTPSHVGRAAHALLFDAVRQVDAALADELHAGDDLRPFTVSDLFGYSHRRGLQPDQVVTLRFTALTAPVARALLAAAREGPLRIGAEVRLAEGELRVEAITAEHQAQPWAGMTSYQDLSAPWLLGRSTPERRLRLQFLSPTTFKSAGRHVPVPLPSLVFGSLLEKWNAFAPIAFPPEARRYADECLALSAYQLKSRAVAVKEGGLRIGAVGHARYTTTNYDRYWMSIIHLLADFAFYSSVGVGTGMGLGQCRRIVDAEPQPTAEARP